jgi:hypothetical protein
MVSRDAGGGGAGGARAPPSFGISVNPIRTKGGRLCPPITTGPPIFLDDAASLNSNLLSYFLDTIFMPLKKQTLHCIASF